VLADKPFNSRVINGAWVRDTMRKWSGYRETWIGKKVNNNSGFRASTVKRYKINMWGSVRVVR
jgi:hypothetical protein